MKLTDLPIMLLERGLALDQNYVLEFESTLQQQRLMTRREIFLVVCVLLILWKPSFKRVFIDHILMLVCSLLSATVCCHELYTFFSTIVPTLIRMQKKINNTPLTTQLIFSISYICRICMVLNNYVQMIPSWLCCR